MIFDNFNYKMFQFSIGSILKCKMKRDFKMGTFGALLLEGGARRAPSAPPGRCERSEHINKSLTIHRAERDRDFTFLHTCCL